MHADTLLVHANLATCSATRPKRGVTMRDVGLIPDGALAITDGKIVAVGSTADVLNDYDAPEIIDAEGKAVVPGLIDCHTHLIYAGDRIDEFEMRLAGARYMDILAAGGGILSTVHATRAASLEALIESGQGRLSAMLAHGTTTAEVKTGYGLDLESELKILKAIESVDQTHAVDLLPTFLGAHVVPPELHGDGDAYIRYLIDMVLPAAVRWYQDSHFARSNLPLGVDVFCEQHAFSVQQSRVMLEAGHSLGLQIHAHVDQFNAFGGLKMVLGLGAASVDHLEATTPEGIQAIALSDTVAVLLPACAYQLGGNYPRGRALLDSGAVVALASDHNPGSSPTIGLPFVMGLACRQMAFTPAEALNAVTINAAHALRLESRLGSLQVGKQADFVLLDSPDWRALAYQIGASPVRAVYKHGAQVV
jgi:imidazolonepropionase